jgi:UDP-glucose 4-epimerase
MHFAAFLDVAESVREPARYYRNKTPAPYPAPHGTCPIDTRESV